MNLCMPWMVLRPFPSCGLPHSIYHMDSSRWPVDWLMQSIHVRVADLEVESHFEGRFSRQSSDESRRAKRQKSKSADSCSRSLFFCFHPKPQLKSEVQAVERVFFYHRPDEMTLLQDFRRETQSTAWLTRRNVADKCLRRFFAMQTPQPSVKEVIAYLFSR